MIIWFTGQPGAGKTTLANVTKKRLLEVGLWKEEDIYMIDGDDLRKLRDNFDYSIEGRIRNVYTAQKIAHYLDNLGKTVIVSIVAPYKEQRDKFKQIIENSGSELLEFYVYTSEERGREEYFAESYLPPKRGAKNTYYVDTTNQDPSKLLNDWILSAIID